MLSFQPDTFMSLLLPTASIVQSLFVKVVLVRKVLWWWVAEALPTGDEGPRIETVQEKNSVFTQQGMGTQLSSELEKVKAVKKRDGTPAQLLIRVGSPTATFLHGFWPKETPTCLR